MHKSIFLRTQEFGSNPISEYNKLSKFIEETECYSYITIFDLFSQYFKFSKRLRNVYIDLDDCINKNIALLESYSQAIYTTLPDDIQDKLLDEFFTYCEILIHMYRVASERFSQDRLDYEIYLQFSEMLEKSLLSIGYKIENLDDDIRPFEIIPINTEAEIIADQSPKTIRESIIKYLGVRAKDLKNKEICLLNFVILLEPAFKQYDTLKIVKKISEFTQLIRHLETKKEEKQYSWFYENEDEHLDRLFTLCIFVQNYEIAKNTLNDFAALKSNTSKGD